MKKSIQEIMKNTNYEGYLRDCQTFSLGASAVGLLAMIVIGPKKWFKATYSKKGVAIGLLFGIASGIWMLLKNQEKQDNPWGEPTTTDETVTEEEME